jgi:hypothetical protein
MRICYLEQCNRQNIKEIYLNYKKRLATSSGIQFIDSNHFVVCSMAGQKLYLYKIDENNIILLDSIDATYNGNLVMVDLISLRNNLVIGSNFKEGTQTLYKIDNNEIKHYKDIPDINLSKNFCHGVKFYNDNIICATNNKIFGINFIDINSDKLLFTIFLKNPEDNPKDIEFINKTNSNKMFIITTTSKIYLNNLKNKKKQLFQNNNVGKILYCDIDINNKYYNILDEFELNKTHLDSLVYYKNLIFVNNQITGAIDVLYLQNEKIHFFRELSGYSFPHGVDIEPNNNLLGVSNYGTNSVNIINLPEDILNLIETIKEN